MIDLPGDLEKDLERSIRQHRRIVRFLEFFVIGLLFGVAEDLIVVLLATDENIAIETVAIAAGVALPFAIFSEIIVDKPEVRDFVRKLLFRKTYRRHSGQKSKKKQP